MKKKNIAYTSYLSFILAIATFISEKYILSVICYLAAIFGVYLFSSRKRKPEIKGYDIIVGFVQLIYHCFIKYSLTRISNALLVMAILSIAYNFVFFIGVRTLTNKSIDYIIKLIGGLYSLLIVLSAIGFGLIAYFLKLESLVSVGYLYLLISNYLPIIIFMAYTTFKRFSKKLVLA